MPVLNNRDQPALWLVLFPDHTVDTGKPFTCESCPKGKLDDPYREVCNDLSEAHYRCAFFPGERVWGESPKCTDQDWRKAAQAELAACGVVLKTVDALVQEAKDQYVAEITKALSALPSGSVLVITWDKELNVPVVPNAVNLVVQTILRNATIQANEQAKIKRKAPFDWEGKPRYCDQARVTEQGLLLEWSVPEVGVITYLSPWNEAIAVEV